MAIINWKSAWDALRGKRPEIIEQKGLNPDKKTIEVNLPSGRISKPSHPSLDSIVSNLGDEVAQVSPSFNRDVIPTIRKLCMVNPDMSQALQNVVNLGNTGHKINFDRKVEDSVAERMRNHLENKHKIWASGQAGMDGLVNRMFSQVMIAGALSNEWVPSIKRDTIESVLFVNPEEIVFVLDKRRSIYHPYQMRNFFTGIGSTNTENLIKLNPLTYQYYALNGDGEAPYGFPPYMAALRDICTQDKMKDNIDFIVDQIGILGFLEILVQIPEQSTGESDAQYKSRVESYLTSAKARVSDGFKDGVLVGAKDMHEFKFNSVGRDFDKVVELFKNNELQIASALKQDATLWGRDYNSSETQITVIFMKMLSELRNIQNIIKTNLEFGYTLELRLAGFNFEYLKVEFDRSTIQDDLKFQQALEYKIKNYKDLYLMGAISSTQFANEMGFEAPDQPKPRVNDEILAGVKSTGAEGETGNPRKDQKNKSDRKQRDKAKPHGTIKPK